MRGRPLRGWLEIDIEQAGDTAELCTWVDRGVARAGSLPPK